MVYYDREKKKENQGMKNKTNIIVVIMLLVIGVVFGFSLEMKNFRLEEQDAAYKENWENTLDNYDQSIVEDNIHTGNDDNKPSIGQYDNFYDLIEYANSTIAKSKSLSSEANGNIHAVITKSGLVSAGMSSAMVNMIPGNGMELDDVIKFVAKKDKMGNRYFGLGFHGELPSYAQNLNIPNRLNVAHYFDGMQYYVGESKDIRVEQNCDPYVDQFRPMNYDEYMQDYYNDIGDLFYTLNQDTVSSECIDYFMTPTSPKDGYEVRLTLTGESLQKATEKVDKQHKLLLAFADYSHHNSLTLTLSFTYTGELTKMVVKENFDTKYAVLGINAPINVEFQFTQTFNYKYSSLIDMSPVQA